MGLEVQACNKCLHYIGEHDRCDKIYCVCRPEAKPCRYYEEIKEVQNGKVRNGSRKRHRRKR